MRIRITCLINDSVGMEGFFWGEHGVSYLIETGGRYLLFDTGSSWEVLHHNLQQLKLNLNDISYIVLSHGHYDHTGGLMGVLSQSHYPTIVADPLLFNRKVSRNSETGEMREIGIPHSRVQVEALADLHLTIEPAEVLPGVTVTGRIPRLTNFEPTPPHMLTEVEGRLEPDWLLDDRSMVVDLGDRLVLLSGCCHSGLINTLLYVETMFGKPLATVAGGIHLNGAKPERIERTIGALQTHFQPDLLYFNHCTGLEATAALMNVFGERVKPFLVGTVLEYD